MMAPAKRSGGISARAWFEGFEGAGAVILGGDAGARPSTTRSSVLPSRADGFLQRLFRRRRPGARRLPYSWLWLRSMTATAISASGSRSSWRIDRIEQARQVSRASARPRSSQPRQPGIGAAGNEQARPRPARARSAPAAAGRGRSEIQFSPSTARAFRAVPAHAPGRPCSCRSAHTSRC